MVTGRKTTISSSAGRLGHESQDNEEMTSSAPSMCTTLGGESNLSSKAKDRKMSRNTFQLAALRHKRSNSTLASFSGSCTRTPPRERCGVRLDPLHPTCQFSDLPNQLPRLRVAIFNAFPSRVLPHPGARCCRVALISSPWFYSKAVARFIWTHPVRMENGPWLSFLPPVKVELLQAEDICAGRLRRPTGPYSAGYDVFLVPGGSAKADFVALGVEGCAAVRRFVQSGGGYCGVCAGAFLALRLRLLDVEKRRVKLQEPHLWGESSDSEGEVAGDARPPLKASRSEGRDPFIVKVKFTQKGRKLLWHEGRSKAIEADESVAGEVCMRYHNGPLVDIPKASSAVLLSRMAAREVQDKAPSMKGSAGIVMQDFGGGRVVAISPHPESTQDESLLPEPGKERLRRVLQRAVLLAAAGPAAHSWLEEEIHVPVPV